jgi:hypothetical protein
MIDEILYRFHTNILGKVAQPGRARGRRSRAVQAGIDRQRQCARARRGMEQGGRVSARPLQRSGRADRQARELGLAAVAQRKLVRAAGFNAWRDFIGRCSIAAA